VHHRVNTQLNMSKLNKRLYKLIRSILLESSLRKLEKPKLKLSLVSISLVREHMLIFNMCNRTQPRIRLNAYS
jgi:hypothetical protein